MCKKSSWCIMLGMLIDAKLCPECFLSTHYVWIQLRCWCSVTSHPRAQRRSYRTKTFSVYEAADTVAVTLSPLTAAQYLHQISTIYTIHIIIYYNIYDIYNNIFLNNFDIIQFCHCLLSLYLFIFNCVVLSQCCLVLQYSPIP